MPFEIEENFSLCGITRAQLPPYIEKFQQKSALGRSLREVCSRLGIIAKPPTKGQFEKVYEGKRITQLLFL